MLMMAIIVIVIMIIICQLNLLLLLVLNIVRGILRLLFLPVYRSLLAVFAFAWCLLSSSSFMNMI